MALKPAFDYDGFNQKLRQPAYVEKVEQHEIDRGEAKEFKPVALFLCTHEFNEGDRVINIHTGTGEAICTRIVSKIAAIIEWTDENLPDNVKEKKFTTESDFENWYKAIGMISEEALSFVNEWDEFNENDLCIRYTNMHGILCAGDYGELSFFSEEKFKKLQYVKIGVKGPCGHFH